MGGAPGGAAAVAGLPGAARARRAPGGAALGRRLPRGPGRRRGAAKSGARAAQVLALARKMRRKRARTDALDAAYHRFAFHDNDLPRWFYEDERRHMLCAPRARPAGCFLVLLPPIS